MNMTAWLLMCTYLFTAWFIWKHVGLNLSLTSVFLTSLLILHGPVYLYYTRIWGPETEFFHTILSSAGDEPVIMRMDSALIMTFIGVCIGVKFSDLFSKQNGKDIKGVVELWSIKGTLNYWFNQRLFYIALVMAVSILLFFMINEDQLSKTINYLTLGGTEFDKIALRRESGGSSIYLYNLACSTFFPFLAFLGIASFKKISIQFRFLFGVFFLLLFLAKVATLSKAPPLIFLLQCVVVLIAIHRLTLSYKIILMQLSIMIGLFYVVTVIAIPNIGSVESIFEFMFYRILMITNESLLEYFSAIPSSLNFSWGSQYSLIAWLMDKPQSLEAYWTVGEIHRGIMSSTTTAMFLGDAWASFSWLGVIFFPIILGLILRYLDRYLLVKKGKTVVTISALILGHYGIFIALNTSLQTSLLTGGLILVLPFTFIFVTPFRKINRAIPISGA